MISVTAVKVGSLLHIVTIFRIPDGVIVSNMVSNSLLTKLFPGAAECTIAEELLPYLRVYVIWGLHVEPGPCPCSLDHLQHFTYQIALKSILYLNYFCKVKISYICLIFYTVCMHAWSRFVIPPDISPMLISFMLLCSAWPEIEFRGSLSLSLSPTWLS